MPNRVINKIELEYLLTKQTKEELLEISRSLNIKGVSNLRKSKLIGLLSKRLPEIVALKMQSWDQSIYDLMQQIISSESPYYLKLEDDEFFAEDYLLSESIAFLGEDDYGEYLLIPQETQQLFLSIDGSAYKARIELNTKIARLTKGLLYYYGCLSLDELAQYVNQFLPERQEAHNIWTILWEVGLYNWDISADRGYFCDGRLTDFDYILAELQTRRNLEYRPVSYDEVWEAGNPAYLHGQAPEVQGLIMFLEEKGLREFSSYFLDLLFGLVQTELAPPEVVFALVEHLEVGSETDITELALLVFDFYHHVPHWVLKGHSPDEIMEHAPRQLHPIEQDSNRQMGVVYDFATRKRVDQDAFCPCGSQRKFKHCCGLKVVPL